MIFNAVMGSLLSSPSGATFEITVMVWTAPAAASGSQGSRAKMVVVEQPLQEAPSTPSP
jgi:hypothetical protein